MNRVNCPPNLGSKNGHRIWTWRSPTLGPANERVYNARVVERLRNFDCGFARKDAVAVARTREDRRANGRDVFQPARQPVHPTAGSEVCEALQLSGALWKTS